MLALKLRVQARRFAQQLHEKLRVEPIETQATYNGWVLLVDGILVEVIVRRFRIFDGVRVWHKGAEIWLPLLQRIKLRNTIRLLVTERAQDEK